MNRLRLIPSLLALAAGISISCGAQATQDTALARTFAITDARIFDGTQMIAKGTVVVKDGRIVAVGPKVAPPADAELIDAGGATLLPGLIDGHTHTFGNALERALVFGVTTELDMFTAPELAKQMREEQARTGAPNRADLRSAGILATAPGGHGSQFGIPIPVLTKPEEAEAFVKGRIAEGSDYIKIVAEDGSAYGRKIPALDRATIRALIDAAHRHGKLAVVHISTQARAKEVIEDGADGLVHLFGDQAPEPGFAALVAKHKAFVVPTLTVIESTTGVASGQSLTENLGFKPYLRAEEVSGLKSSFPKPQVPDELSFAFDTVKQLKAAGVPILAGSDAPNPGTAHGASLHRELELLVKAGLTPTEALAAATSVPARLFKLDDRGRIAPGLRADLVLIAGDPASDITATRNIVRIWKAGHPVERPIAPAAPATKSAAVPAGGTISDFDDGTLSTAFGSGWMESTDTMAGGKSVVKTQVVDGGAESSAKALEISGEVKEGFAYPWSGMLFSPGIQPMTPTDLSAAKGIEFWARGDGKTYQVLFFAASRGRMPAQQSFVAGPEWKKYSFTFGDFQGLDGKDVSGLFFGGGPALGEFKFRIDGVRLVDGK